MPSKTSPLTSIAPPMVRVRLARTTMQLEKIGIVRSLAYSKHLPDLPIDPYGIEAQDNDPNTINFYCEDIASENVLGSMRISVSGKESLPVQKNFLLPLTLIGCRLAEISRLVIPSSRQNRFVKALLFKALYQYCIATQIRWMIATARPPLDAEYIALDFIDLTKDTGPIPVDHVWGIDHKVLAFEVTTAERRWHKINHPLYKFMLNETHPEIQLFDSVAPMWVRPRLDESETSERSRSADTDRRS
jgi:hypothetical protein